MTILTVVSEIVQAVIRYFKYDWWILALGITTAVVIKVYFTDRMSKIANHKSNSSIIGAVGVGAFTPLCACGTMAVLLSMFVSSLPWGTVMAFLLTSPLTSPTQFIFQAGILGSRFAVAGLISAVALGLFAGLLAQYLDKNTSFFKGQYRLTPALETIGSQTNPVSCCDAAPFQAGVSCCSSQESRPSACATGQAETACSTDFQPGYQSWIRRWKLDQVLVQIYELGVKRVLLYFALFIALGRLVELFIPTEAILMMFSPDKFYSVPLAALVGLPLYVSGAAGLPLLDTFLKAGAGDGAVLAFLIAGQGTSVGVMIGIATFIGKRAIAFYVAMVLTGAVVAGLIYQLITSLSIY